MAAAQFGRRIGRTAKEIIVRKKSVQGPCHDPFMAAASRAIAERIPLVDLIVHVTDARVPLSSQCDLLRNYQPSLNHIIVLNKADLASRSGLQWRGAIWETNRQSSKRKNRKEEKKSVQGPWHDPFMAAASRAIAERIPSVDLIIRITDARLHIPLSSQCDLLRNYQPSLKHIIALNKADLASRSGLQAWTEYFREKNCMSCGVNAHNKDSIRQFLSLIQRQVGKLRRHDHTNYIATVMLIGIPNVGKSALANALHQEGRISAAEKGKLKHATVSPEPGETKDIRSYKIGGHPNIYVLDTPAVLSPEVPDVDVLSKLILTGANGDCLVGIKEIAQYFLAIHNSSEQYEKWAKLSTKNNDRLFLNSTTECFGLHMNDRLILNNTTECLTSSGLHMKQKKQIPPDHTQDCIVQDVRRTLYETVSSFDGNIRCEVEMEALIGRQFTALQEAFHVPTECEEDAHVKVAGKLLNLFRTGRLGHYIFDDLPRNIR